MLLYAVAMVASSTAWTASVRATCLGTRALPQCNADVQEPKLVALTAADVRSLSMDSLEILIEEMEAAALNHFEAESGHHIHLSRLLATAHTCYGDNILAVPHARIVLEAGPDPEMHFFLGVEAERRDAEDEALDEYDAALSIDPGYWRALFHVAKICLMNGWTADAVDYLKQVAAINPSHEPTVAFLARYQEEGASSSAEDAPSNDDAVGQEPPPAVELPTDGTLPEGLV